MIYSKALEWTEEVENVFGIVVTCFERDFESECKEQTTRRFIQLERHKRNEVDGA